MKNLFAACYHFFSKRKLLLYAIFFGLLIFFAYLASQLTLENDLSAMMPKEKNAKDVSSILTHHKQLDKMIVSVSLMNEVSDPDLLIAFTDEFAKRLIQNDHKKIIASVETKQNEEQFAEVVHAVQNNLPFILDENDYAQIDSLIKPENLKTILETNYRTLASPGGLAMKQLIAKDPIGISYLALKKLQDLQQDENTIIYDGYIFAKDEKELSFFIHPTHPSSQTKLNEGLQTLINNTVSELKQKEEYRQINFHCFGAHLVAAGNATQMRSDTILTLSITIILLLLLFIFFFRNRLAPLQIMIPVVFGGLFGMAMMYLFKGKVSMISLGASSVILGIAVNYSLHFLSHFRHSHDKETSIRELVIPMTIGSFTTIFAFLSLQLLHTPVLRELGLFTAFNLIGSSLCTLIFLPHFMSDYKIDKPLKSDTAFNKKNHTTWLDTLAHYAPNKNKWIVIGICLITIFLAFYANKVRFNEDMMKMNYMSEELIESQKIINAQNAESLNSVFCVSEGNTLDEALNHNEIAGNTLAHLKKEGIIRKFSNPGNFILSDSQQQLKLAKWNHYWTKEKKSVLHQKLLHEGNAIGFDMSAFTGITTILNTEYTQTDSNFKNTFNTLFKDFIVLDSSGYKLMVLIKISQEKRSQLFQEFIASEGSYLTDRQLITSKFVQYVKDDFYKILFLTSFIVFFTILISYGRIELALISFIPMLITWICILGLMGLFRIEFNIINIIISTLIFGLGDDYSIFITDGLIEKYKYGKRKLDAIKTSIYLSAITTIIGLGVLIFAKHPALRSIALVSVIGIGSILLVSQTLQPLLFNFFIQNRADKKQHPFTLWSFTKTIFAFLLFAIGCIIITILGFILTKCIPFAKDKMKYIYHIIISKSMWGLLYLMMNTKKIITDKKLADFRKPSVLIANHGSFLDLLRIISLYPKILLLTNKWVWRSPVFGFLVRMADYYPVEEGVEFSIDKLKYWVDRGYSIAVFPEGTRSYDGEIKRFHKGAFYIAEQLQLDLQPIVIQGIAYTLSKGDFLLKDGDINLKFLPRIPFDDTIYGNTYTERAKQIGKYFRAEYDALRNEKEDASYYQQQLIRNYIYKGPVLEWYCRIKTKLESHYSLIESLVPQKGNILDIGCGYGFLDYMLLFTSKERNIKGIDYDEEKIEVARNNFSKNDQINFETKDALVLPENERYDCIILLDVLHYLSPENQELLLNKIARLLASGAVFILREGITDLKHKIKGTRLTEFFSTTIFKFNKTENELHFVSMQFIEQFAAANNLSFEVIDETKFTSNVIVVMKKKLRVES